MSFLINRNNRVRIGLLCFVAVATSFSLVSTARAQKYAVINIPAKFLDKIYLNDVKKVVNASVHSELDSTKEQKLREYYAEFYYADFTHLQGNDKDASDLPTRRKRILDEVKRYQKNTETHRFLVGLIHDQWSRLFGVNVHPAVKVNAMLLLGELNELEYNPGLRQAPRPYPRALSTMLAALKSTNVPEGVKISAMYGLRRHAYYSGNSLAPADRGQLLAKMVQLAKLRQQMVARMDKDGDGVLTGGELDAAKKTLQRVNMSIGGLTWMQRRAAEILGLVGDPGQNGEVIVALYELYASKDAPQSLRCAAADAMGQLNPPRRQPPVSVADMSTQLLELGIDSCQAELDAIAREKEHEEKDFIRSARRDDVVLPQPAFKLERARRRITYQLTCVRSALMGSSGNGGLNRYAQGQDKAKINKIVRGVDSLLASAEQTASQATMVDELNRTVAALGEIAGRAAPAAPATPEPMPEPQPASPDPAEDVPF